MTVSYEQMLAGESEETRAWVKERAAVLIAEEMRLRELRRLRRLTQARLSKKLNIGQEGISRMEKRTDLYISTLRSYVEGVGGKLSLVVEFPDHPPVILAGLGMDYEDSASKRRKNAKSKGEEKPKSRTKSAGKLLQSA